MNKTLLLLSSLTVHCSYRLKFFVVKDHLWDGNSHKCSLLGSVPLKAPEGLSVQSFHPVVLYATQTENLGRRKNFPALGAECNDRRFLVIKV